MDESDPDVVVLRRQEGTPADLAINSPAYACRQLGRTVEAGKRQAASNATRQRSIEDPRGLRMALNLYSPL